VLLEVQLRECPVLEPFLQRLRLSMWPAFQKQMHMHTESIRKMVNNTGASLLRSSVKAVTLRTVAQRYVSLFVATVLLCAESEGMVFSNLMRLRDVVLQLIVQTIKQAKVLTEKDEYLRVSIGCIVGDLVKYGKLNTHQKAQTEMSFWRQKESEVRLNFKYDGL